jgi:predicted transcriptional regulator
MQLELVRSLLRMLIERIIGEIFPRETGAARLQQLGLLLLIFAYEEDGKPVTATRLAELTGQSRNRVYKQLEKLDAVDVIDRMDILSPHGRGRTFALSIKHNAKTKRLLKLLEKAAVARVSRARERKSLQLRRRSRRD